MLRQGYRAVLKFRQFRNDESGATSIEYALIAVGITVAIVTAVLAVGSAVQSDFSAVQRAFN